jgi:hypothetical protein
MIREDCFAYNSELNECNCLTTLVCKKKDCSFYTNREEVSLKSIENAINGYSAKSLKKLNKSEDYYEENQ